MDLHDANIIGVLGTFEWDETNARGTWLLGNVRVNFGRSNTGAGTSHTATYHTAFSVVPYSLVVSWVGYTSVAGDERPGLNGRRTSVSTITFDYDSAVPDAIEIDYIAIGLA